MKAQVALTRIHPQALSSKVLRTIRYSIDLIGGPMNLCSRGNTVLVKPNIASPDGFSSTNPAVTWPVLVIDVDGTLLDTKADLTPFTREVLNRYLDTGGPGIPDLSTFQL